MRKLVLLSLWIFLPTLAHAATAQLTWQDNSTNEEGFIVEKRQQSEPGSYVEIGRTAANTVTYRDSVTPGMSICYQVKAFNAAGASDPSNEACTVVPVTPTIPASPTDLQATQPEEP